MASEFRIGFTLLFLAAAAAAAAAPNLGSGSVYMCTDARGKTITSDQPPPQCADRPIKELRSDGSVRRVIEPPLTAAQREAKAAEERRKADEETQRRDQVRRDKALLDAYADEKEIEFARTRTVENRRVIIDRARKRMDELAREKKKLDDEAEFYAKREKPDRLKRAYDTNATMVQAQEKIIADTEAEMNRINERFDADIKRYRELMQTGARPAQRSASTAPR